MIINRLYMICNKYKDCLDHIGCHYSAPYNYFYCIPGHKISTCNNKLSHPYLIIITLFQWKMWKSSKKNKKSILKK